MVLCSKCVVGTYVDGVELEMEIVEVSRAPRSCKNRASLTTEGLSFDVTASQLS